MASLLLVLLGATCLVLGADSVNTKVNCNHGLMNGNVTFNVSSSSPLDSILWTKAKNKVAEWDKRSNSTNTFSSFVGRVQLDTTLGDLTISNLSKSDEGDYVFDNTKLSFCLEVYDPLPSPEINQTTFDGRTIFRCVIPGSDQNQLRSVTFSWNCSSPVCAISSKSKISFENKNTPQEITCTIDNGIFKKSVTITPTPPQSHQMTHGRIGISITLACILFIIIIGAVIWFKKKQYFSKWLEDCTAGTGRPEIEYAHAETQDKPVSPEES